MPRRGARPLGDAAYHLSLPLLESRSVVGRTLRDAPHARRSLAPKPSRSPTPCATPLVSWRDREGRAERLLGGAVSRSRGRFARAENGHRVGLGACRADRSPAAAAAPARTRSEPAGTFGMRVGASFPSGAVDRPPVAVRRGGAQHRQPDHPERRRHDRLLRLHLKLPGTGGATSARCGRSTRARCDRLSARSKRRTSACPAAVRPPTSTRGRSARCARARRSCSCGGSCPSRPAPSRSTTSSPRGSPARPRRGSKRQAGIHGKFAVYIKPAPDLKHVNPNTGQVEVGAVPPARPSRAGAEGAAPASQHRAGAEGAAPAKPDRAREAPPAASGVWPAVERSPPRFRHAVDPFRPAWHYDCVRLRALAGAGASHTFSRRNRPSPCPGPASRTSPPRSGAPTEPRSGRPT